MTFRSPAMLAWLVAVPAAVIAYMLSRRSRARRAAALAAEGLAPASSGRGKRVRPHVPFALFAIALAALVIALARPQATVRTPKREGTVVVAMDVSNSMAATDITPSRIEAAKTAARAFVRRQPSTVRVGVVAFGDGAVVVQPPTTTQSTVVAAINRLSLGGGTSLGQGLIASLSAIAGKPVTVDQNALQTDEGKVDVGYFGSATIVVFSDGENVSRLDPVSIANIASVAGVRVHTLGVGTAAGAVVQVDGFNVATALDRDVLQKIASVTNGSYHEAGDAAGLAAISETIDLRFKVVSQHTEVTALFAGAGVVLLLAGGMLSVLWFGRVA